MFLIGLLILWLAFGYVIYMTVMQEFVGIKYKNPVVWAVRVIIIIGFWPIVAGSYFGARLALAEFNKNNN